MNQSVVSGRNMIAEYYGEGCSKNHSLIVREGSKRQLMTQADHSKEI